MRQSLTCPGQLQPQSQPQPQPRRPPPLQQQLPPPQQQRGGGADENARPPGGLQRRDGKADENGHAAAPSPAAKKDARAAGRAMAATLSKAQGMRVLMQLDAFSSGCAAHLSERCFK